MLNSPEACKGVETSASPSKTVLDVLALTIKDGRSNTIFMMRVVQIFCAVRVGQLPRGEAVAAATKG